MTTTRTDEVAGQKPVGSTSVRRQGNQAGGGSTLNRRPWKQDLGGSTQLRRFRVIFTSALTVATVRAVGDWYAPLDPLFSNMFDSPRSTLLV